MKRNNHATNRLNGTTTSRKTAPPPPPPPPAAARRRTRARTEPDGTDSLMQAGLDSGKAMLERATTPRLSSTLKIPLALIAPPVHNPRETFPEEEIRSLADSIAAVGLLHPVIVRPSPAAAGAGRYELVAGECRLRAVALLGDTSIDCSVRDDLGDVECAEIRLLENVDRRSLNAAEEGHALRILHSLGHTTETLAALLRIGEDDVAARLQLASLPEFWQTFMRAERDPRRGVACERLTAWLDCPHVLAAMQPVADRWPLTLSTWQRELTDVVLRLSRDCDPQSPVGPVFRIDKPLAERLKVKEIRVGNAVQRRAMATELWDELQDRGVAAPGKKRRPILGTPATNGNGHAAGGPAIADGVGYVPTPSARETGQSAGPQPSTLNPQPPLAIVDQGPDESDFDARLARWTDGWLRELLHRRITAMDLPELNGLIAHCGIDLAAEYKTTRWFLDLHSGRQLLELAKTWGVDVADARDRGELIAGLLATKTRHTLPPSLANVIDPADVVAV